MTYELLVRGEDDQVATEIFKAAARLRRNTPDEDLSLLVVFHLPDPNQVPHVGAIVCGQNDLGDCAARIAWLRENQFKPD